MQQLIVSTTADCIATILKQYSPVLFQPPVSVYNILFITIKLDQSQQFDTYTFTVLSTDCKDYSKWDDIPSVYCLSSHA